MGQADYRRQKFSADNFYPPCPHCDRNRNGLFTRKATNNHAEWYCEKCRESFDTDQRSGVQAEQPTERRN